MAPTTHITPAATSSVALSFTVASTTATVNLEENFHIIEGADALTDEARERIATIEYSRRHLARACGAACECNRPPVCGDCLDLIDGLEALANCAAEWVSDRRCFSEKPAWTLFCLRSLPQYQQVTVHNLFKIFLRTNDWVTADRQAVEQGDFKISAVLWALQLGPQGLAAGWMEGVETIDILMRAEEAWIAEHVDADGYTDMKQTLKGFANLLASWDRGVLDENVGGGD